MTLDSPLIYFIFVPEADYTLDESFWIEESPAGEYFEFTIRIEIKFCWALFGKVFQAINVITYKHTICRTRFWGPSLSVNGAEPHLLCLSLLRNDFITVLLNGSIDFSR